MSLVGIKRSNETHEKFVVDRDEKDDKCINDRILDVPLPSNSSKKTVEWFPNEEYWLETMSMQLNKYVPNNHQ